MIIKVIYDDGNNTMVNVLRDMRKSKKNLKDMSANELARKCFGM